MISQFCKEQCPIYIECSYDIDDIPYEECTLYKKLKSGSDTNDD